MPISLEELLGSVDSGCLPDPVLYMYYKMLYDRKIVINEEVCDNLLEKATLPYMAMDSDGSGELIEIYINTIGGDIYNGFNLIDQIERAKTPTTIHIMGLAASMGTLIALAGKHNENVKTVCHPFSVGLLHSGYQYMEGSAHAVKDTFDFSQHYEEKIKSYILSHSKITEEYYEKVEHKELWLDADEMLRLGIVDEII